MDCLIFHETSVMILGTSDQILEVIWIKLWILDPFEIFVNITVNEK